MYSLSGKSSAGSSVYLVLVIIFSFPLGKSYCAWPIIITKWSFHMTLLDNSEILLAHAVMFWFFPECEINLIDPEVRNLHH